MADLSDVMAVLSSTISATVYPNGTSQASIANALISVVRGWPTEHNLKQALDAGHVIVSVYPLATEKILNAELGRPYQTLNPGTQTISVTVSGKTVTFGGSVSTPQNLYILVNGQGYQYAVQSTDTLTTIATAFTGMIAGASSSGAVLTVPSAYTLVARVGAVGSAIRELKRQQKEFQITVWAPSPTIRDTVASALDIALSALVRLSFTDGSLGNIGYARTLQTDNNQLAKLYRRDLVYSVDYPTIQTIAAPQVVAPILNIDSMQSGQLIKQIQE